MSGYRDTSSGYDPLAYEQPGPPLRPYNWVQRTGVVLELLAIAAMGYFALVILHKLPDVGINGIYIAVPLQLVSFLLIYSRRAPGTPAGTEQLRKNRQVLLITVLVCAVILGAATVIEFTGA